MGREKVKNDNKSNSEIKSNSLFDFVDIKNNKIRKNANNNDSSVFNSSNSASSNNKKNSKTNDKSVRKTRQSNNNTTKVADKSKRRISKTEKNNRSTKNRNKKDTNKLITNNYENKEIITEKTKVGRRDRKHGWYKGLDQVWVEGIDHWVCTSAFRNEKGKEPIYSLNNYVQGLDSYWVMRYIPNKKK